MNVDHVELVLVDFDDTLVDTGPRFQNARRSLLALLGAAGFDEAVVHDVLYNRVDPAMRRRYGLGPRRMEPAFAAVYEQLCELQQRHPDAELEARLRELGRSCFGAPPVFEGALDALQRLAEVHPTVIYTQSGDIEYQLSCVRDTGVIDIVREDRVHVCERKDADMFRSTLSHWGVIDPAAAWMIGNSIRSDINPALEAGANAILIETEDPWEYDQVEPHAATFLRMPTFSHAVHFLLT